MNFIKKYFSKIDANHQFKLGQEELKKGRIDNAIVLFSRAINKFNDHIPSLYSRGSLYIDHFKWNEALDDFEKVHNLKPNAENIHFLLGICQCSIGHTEIGFKNLEKQIELTPEKPESYWNRAIFYNRMRQYDSALVDINKAIDISPKNPYLHSIKGKILENLSMMSEAEKSYITGFNLEKAPGDSTFRLKEFYKRANNIESSIRVVEKILTEFPHDPETLAELSEMYNKIGDDLSAKEYYKKAKTAGWED